MKIVSLKTCVLRSYEYPNGGWVLVRLRTEGGVEGLGECFVPDRDGRGAQAARALIEESFKRLVIGQSALDIAPLWERLYALCCGLYDRRGLAIHALSGIDMALYDAAGKILGVPVYALLGGLCRERVRLYVSSIFVDPQRAQQACAETRHYAEQGFQAIKYYGWPGFGANRRQDMSILRELRRAAGEGVDLMLDLGRPADLSEALRTARLIEQSGADIYWWEEPFSSSDQTADLAALRARTDLRIAAGEAELTAFAFRELVQKEAVDLLQPDLSWVGGLTEGRRIAELARLHNIPFVPHNWGTVLNFAASIHLVAAMPRGFLCEYPITPRTRGAGHPQTLPDFSAPLPQAPSPMMAELARTGVEVEDGHALVPRTPGLGVELNEQAVARYTLR